MGVPLWPLHQAAGIERIVVSTYQSASGAGAQAMAELESQSRAHAGASRSRRKFSASDRLQRFLPQYLHRANGYNEEENKVIEETRKIFHEPELPIVATCIRVPVLRAHSESIVIETRRALSPEEAREILSKAPGVKVVDSREKNHFPCRSKPAASTTSSSAASARTSRTRAAWRSSSAGDQLLKGAAWNAVQILEELVK